MADTPAPTPPDQAANGFVARLNTFLDQRVLPYPVRYLTNRLVILLTLCLLIPLIIFASNQVLVLLANSYLNVMSVVVSSTVLLYATIAEARDKVAAQRREEIAAKHEAMVEQRAETDHQLIESIRTELIQHVNNSLDNIQSILIGRLQSMQSEDHAHIEEMHAAMMASSQAQQEDLAAQREELADLRILVQALHNGRMGGDMPRKVE